MKKERKTAAFMSLLVAFANLGVIAIAINAATFKVFMNVLPTAPTTMLVVITAIISLVIGGVLSSPMSLGKTFLLAVLVASAVIYAIAAIQASIILLFFFWPWSLYKLYRSEH